MTSAQEKTREDHELVVPQRGERSRLLPFVVKSGSYVLMMPETADVPSGSPLRAPYHWCAGLPDGDWETALAKLSHRDSDPPLRKSRIFRGW